MGNTQNKENSPETNRIADYIATMSLFAGENRKALMKIATGLSLVEYQKGTYLLHQGDESSSLFIIAEGRVSFVAMDPATGSSSVIGELGTGHTFGEFGLVYDVRRSAGAMAATDVVVLRLDRQIYEEHQNSKYMKPLSAKVKKVCAMLMRDGLTALPFLKKFDEDLIDDLAHLFRFEVHPAGTNICLEGSPADKFYIVYHGTLVITTHDELGFPVEISRLVEGQKFGDQALLQNESRTATVTSLSPCELFSLEGTDFREFLKQLPGKSEEVRETMLSTSFTTLLQRHAPIFKSVSVQSEQLLGWVSTYMTFVQHEEVVAESEVINTDIYVVCSGSVDIYLESGKVKNLRTGYFGELSLFTNKPSTKVVKCATENCSVLKIPGEAFKKVMTKEPTIYAEIALKVLGRDTPMEYVLMHPEARKGFRAHCEKERCIENVEFWVAVTHLETISDRAKEPEVLKALHQNPTELMQRKQNILKSEAAAIYQSFIKEGSANEINIPGTVRMKVTQRINKNDLSFDMFSEAKDEVYKLLENDTYARYQISEEFQAFLAKLGIYRDN